MTSLSIGELSRQAGVKVPTIRFYEEIGLLPSPLRTASNRRVFDVDAVRRLRFIRHARELGFEVDAIRALLRLSDAPQASCAEADRIARHHLAEVEERIVRLTALRAELQRMVEDCGHGHVCDCRVIEVIADHRLCRHHEHDSPARRPRPASPPSPARPDRPRRGGRHGTAAAGDD
ncbi:MerR family transcriptional regulator [Blastochloris viridis]|uniref:Copper export regulator n=1 Tax=Blastochloris viridis TaxID=1079 RepID=A0A0H5BE67_BLAVI|nr:HTH-type transcriptional regulator HmrR [Blastochloris viridis]BAS00491.1 transcriptional regulator [Blastochloris viridis]CUU42282.1 Copper export regulator [Blastochloris viridis]